MSRSNKRVSQNNGDNASDNDRDRDGPNATVDDRLVDGQAVEEEEAIEEEVEEQPSDDLKRKLKWQSLAALAVGMESQSKSMDAECAFIEEVHRDWLQPWADYLHERGCEFQNANGEVVTEYSDADWSEFHHILHEYEQALRRLRDATAWAMLHLTGMRRANWSLGEWCSDTVDKRYWLNQRRQEALAGQLQREEVRRLQIAEERARQQQEAATD
jgi:hypothetical protein